MPEIPIEEWTEHVIEDKEQTRAIRELKIVVSGDPENPDTLKASLVGMLACQKKTLERLELWLDAWKFALWLIGTTIISAPVWIPGLRFVVHWLAGTS